MTSVTPSLTSTTWSTCSSMIIPMASSTVQSGTQEGNWSLTFQELGLSSISGADAGAEDAAESTGVFTVMKKSGVTGRMESKGHHPPPCLSVMGVSQERYNNTFTLATNAPCTTHSLLRSSIRGFRTTGL